VSTAHDAAAVSHAIAGMSIALEKISQVTAAAATSEQAAAAVRLQD
jgi:ribose 5-phosphate isomerase RpiB